MKRGGDGLDYIRKTVDKSCIVDVLAGLNHTAEVYDRHGAGDAAFGLREAIDTLERDLNLLEGHPTRGWS